MENIDQEIIKLNEWNAQKRHAEVLAEVNTDLSLVTDDDLAEDVASLNVIKGNALIPGAPMLFAGDIVIAFMVFGDHIFIFVDIGAFFA